MTKKEKETFVLNFCSAVAARVMKDVSKMPEDWDGLELREYVADEFDRERHMRNPYVKKDYRARIRRYDREKARI